MKTEYRHPHLGISNIWSTGENRWHWSNAAGESCVERSFEEAVFNAERVLRNHVLTKRLNELVELIPAELAPEACVGEFSAEDDTPTLHVNLWRGLDLYHLPEAVASLEIAAEGHWEGGRCYSLQVA